MRLQCVWQEMHVFMLLRSKERTPVVLSQQGLSGCEVTSEMHEPWMPLLVNQCVLSAVATGLTDIQGTGLFYCYGHTPWYKLDVYTPRFGVVQELNSCKP